MAESTTEKSILKNIKDKGFIVLEEMKKDPVLSEYFKNVKFMEKVVKLERKYFSYAEGEVAEEILLKQGNLLEFANINVKNSDQAVFNAISSYAEAIKYGNPKFLDSEEHAFEAVKGNYKLLSIVNKKFKKLHAFGEAALNQSLDAKDYIGRNLIYNNESIFIRLIKEEKLTEKDLKKFNKKMRTTSTVCEGLVDNCGAKINKLPKYFIGEAKTNAHLASRSILKNKMSYKYLHRSMKKNEDVNRNFIKLYPNDLKMIGRQIYKPEVAKELLSINGLYLKKFAKLNLIFNREIIKAAVIQNGAALKYAPFNFQNDEELVKLAVASYKWPKPLQKPLSNRKQKALEKSPEKLKKYEEKQAKLQAKIEKEMIKNPLKDHPLFNSNKKFRKNNDIMRDSIEVEPLTLALGAKNVKSDEALVAIALSKNGAALKYAAKKLQKSDDMISIALNSPKGSQEAFNVLSKKYVNDPKNEQILIDALSSNADLYFSYPTELKQNPAAIVKILAKHPEAAVNLPLELRQNKAYLQDLAKINTDAYEIAVNSTFKVKGDKSFIKEMEAVIEELKVKQGKTKGANSQSEQKGSNYNKGPEVN